MGIEADLKKRIVAILSLTHQVAGTGFVGSTGYVYTCAHVVRQAGYEPPCEILIRFESDKRNASGSIDEAGWNAELDVAIIKARAAFNPLYHGVAELSPGNDFYSFGYARVGAIAGIGARGKIIDLVGDDNSIQLHSEQVDRGMSGAPVYDLKQRAVIGMISWGRTSTWESRNFNTSLAINLDTVIRIQKGAKPVADRKEIIHQKLIAYVTGAQRLVEEVASCFEQTRIRPVECVSASDKMLAVWDMYLANFFEVLGKNELDSLVRLRTKDYASADQLFDRINPLVREIRAFMDVCLEESRQVQETRISLLQKITAVQLAIHNLHRDTGQAVSR
jgi:hypothetical protein